MASNPTFTLKGPTRYARIVRADKVSGKYQLHLLLDAETADEVIDACRETASTAHPKEYKSGKVSLPFEVLEDGRVALKLRSAWKPSLTDAKGKPIKGDPGIGDGSVLKIRFSVKAGGFGDATKKRSVMLIPHAVMLIDLVAYSEGGWGDDDLEDGYESDGTEAEVEDDQEAEEDQDEEADEAPPPKARGRKVDI